MQHFRLSMVDAANLSIIAMGTTTRRGDILQKGTIHDAADIMTKVAMDVMVMEMVVMEMVVVADLLTRTVVTVPGSANTLRAGSGILQKSRTLMYILY